MKRLTLFIAFAAMAIANPSNAQDFRAMINEPPVQLSGSTEWSNDLVVSSTEPQGRPSGVYRNSNSTIYVSVPDTNIQSGAAIVILASSDNGTTWSNVSALTPASVIPKTKMVIGSLDSVYCFFISGPIVYCWNVLNNRVTQVRGTGFRDFDVASSSTGSMYIFMDSLGTNNIPRYGSSDGGVTWGQRALVTGSGAHPRISFSGTGDTLVLHYYGPVLNDTATSIIRGARYRESAPGTLATVGSFIDVARSNARKEQFEAVRHGTAAWLIYSHEESGDADVRCKVSSNGGSTYYDSTVIGAVSGMNEYWLDAKHHRRNPGGVDVIYQSRTAAEEGSVPAMNFTTALKSSPLSFLPSAKFSDNPPSFSVIRYYPTLIPYYNAAGDAGAIWVADLLADGAPARSIYFDRMISTLNLTARLEACSPVQDTITVQLRSVTSPYGIVDSKRAVLSNLGTATVNFTNAVSGTSYYIAVLHRNSIETWSKSGGETFVNGQLSYDFTTAASQAFGNNMILVGSDYSFYTGDTNQDGLVDGTDFNAIDNDAFAFAGGYIVTDLNCDDIVDVTDLAYADNNAFNFVGSIIPN